MRFSSCVADLAVTKSRSPSGDVAAGTNVTYTVTVPDNGPASVAHVTLTDDVPAGAGFVSVSAPPDWTCTVPAVGTAGTISCEKDSMANGETATFTVVATVNCDVPNGTTIGNTASASAVSPPDNDSSNDSTSASFVVFNPAPVVSASVSTAVLKQNDQNLVNVGLAATATDGACPAPTTFTVQVFSNEDHQGPNGENHFSPDAKDIGIGTLRLRRERLGAGDGRLYLIVGQGDRHGRDHYATVMVVFGKAPCSRFFLMLVRLVIAELEKYYRICKIFSEASKCFFVLDLVPIFTYGRSRCMLAGMQRPLRGAQPNSWKLSVDDR